jgi:hypothetical protein
MNDISEYTAVLFPVPYLEDKFVSCGQNPKSLAGSVDSASRDVDRKEH